MTAYRFQRPGPLHWRGRFRAARSEYQDNIPYAGVSAPRVHCHDRGTVIAWQRAHATELDANSWGSVRPRGAGSRNRCQCCTATGACCSSMRTSARVEMFCMLDCLRAARVYVCSLGFRDRIAPSVRTMTQSGLCSGAQRTTYASTTPGPRSSRPSRILSIHRFQSKPTPSVMRTAPARSP